MPIGEPYTIVVTQDLLDEIGFTEYRADDLLADWSDGSPAVRSYSVYMSNFLKHYPRKDMANFKARHGR